jgi:hypothetical protein
MAAAATLAQTGLSNAITYDMGGTSTDVAPTWLAGTVPPLPFITSRSREKPPSRNSRWSRAT